MTPYYDDGQIQIWHGDCRDVLPKLPPVDLVLTDPPYGIGVDTDNNRFTGGHNSYDSEGNRRSGTGGGDPIANDAAPFDPAFLLHYGCDQVIWGWNHYPDKLPRGACLVWLKRYDEAFASFLSDAEIAYMSKGHGVYCRRDLSNNALALQRVHPTQKPVSLMRWCLTFFPDASLVLDPYMGSGTTLVAARDMDRKAIGIEIDERYCEIAVKRLAQQVLPFATAAD